MKKKENFNFKNIINEELRGLENRNRTSKVNVAETLTVLDDAIENLSLEITSIELTESKSRAAELLKECLNFLNNTRRKLTRL